MHVGLATEANGRRRAAVIGHAPADDLALLRLADSIVVVPGELDGGVVRLRARALEERLRHRRRGHAEQLLGEVDIGLVGAVAVGVEVAEGRHLVMGDLGQALDAEPEGGAPQARDAVEAGVAGIVLDPQALAAAEQIGPLFAVEREVGLGVDHVGHVAGVRRVRYEIHGRPPSLPWSPGDACPAVIVDWHPPINRPRAAQRTASASRAARTPVW